MPKQTAKAREQSGSTVPKWFSSVAKMRASGRLNDEDWSWFMENMDDLQDYPPPADFHVKGLGQGQPEAAPEPETPQPSGSGDVGVPPRDEPKFHAKIRGGEDPTGPFGLGRPMPGREAILRSLPTGGGFQGKTFRQAPTKVTLRQTEGEPDEVELRMVREQIRRMKLDQEDLPPQVKQRAKAQLLDQGIELAQYRADRDQAWEQQDQDFMKRILDTANKLSKKFDKDGNPIPGDYSESIKEALELARLTSPRIFERIEKSQGGIEGFVSGVAEIGAPTAGMTPEEARSTRGERRQKEQFDTQQEAVQGRFEAEQAASNERDLRRTWERGQDRRAKAKAERDRNLANTRSQIRQRAEQIYRDRLEVDPDYTARDAWEAAKEEAGPALEHVGEADLAPPEDFIKSMERRVTKALPAKARRSEIAEMAGAVETAILGLTQDARGLPLPQGDTPGEISIRDSALDRAIAQVQSIVKDISIGDFKDEDRTRAQKRIDAAIAGAPVEHQLMLQAVYEDPATLGPKVQALIDTEKIPDERAARKIQDILHRRRMEILGRGEAEDYEAAEHIGDALRALDTRYMRPLIDKLGNTSPEVLSAAAMENRSLTHKAFVKKLPFWGGLAAKWAGEDFTSGLAEVSTKRRARERSGAQ